jgi:hypothetical protein
MNCQRFEELVSEIARGQMMDADLREAALGHSNDCLACTDRLRDEQSLTRGLHALASQTESLRPPSDIEARLRSAMQQQNARVVPLSTRNVSRRYWVAVAAAVLLFVASAIAINWQRMSTPSGEQTVASKDEVKKPSEQQQPRNTEEKPNQFATAVVQERPKPLVARKQHRRPRRIQGTEAKSEGEVVANHAREIATDFIPLGYMNTASLQDGGHIVRVELPRSAMVSFGLPVNMDRLNEKVKADVWLGVDGLAHAIRFVQ